MTHFRCAIRKFNTVNSLEVDSTINFRIGGLLIFNPATESNSQYPNLRPPDIGYRSRCSVRIVLLHSSRFGSIQLPRLDVPETNRVQPSIFACCGQRYLAEGFLAFFSHISLLRNAGFNSTCFNIHSYQDGEIPWMKVRSVSYGIKGTKKADGGCRYSD